MGKLATVLPGCSLEMRKLPDCLKKKLSSVHLAIIGTHQTTSLVCNSCKPNVLVFILCSKFKGFNFVYNIDTHVCILCCFQENDLLHFTIQLKC